MQPIKGGVNEMTELDIAVKAVQLYANMHPRPSQVNMTQAAQMLNISTPTMRKLLRNGTINMNKAGMISITEVDRILASRV